MSSRAARPVVVVVVAAVLVAAALSGCPSDPRKADDHVVAHIGAGADAVVIREADLLAALSQRGTPRITDRGAREKVARLVLDSMVDDALLLQAAAKAGVTVTDEEALREVSTRGEGYPPGVLQRVLAAEQLTIVELTRKVQRRMTMDAFLRAKLASLAAITDSDVKARFEATDHKLPPQVHARQILLRSGEEATHLLEQIRARKIGFEAAAQKFSTAPEAENGGDLGWFAKGDMPEVFDICFNLDKGAVSDVVVSDYGFHIFQIVDYRDARTETFEEARDRIEEDLMRERQSEAVEALLAQLRTESKVAIAEPALQRVLTLLPDAPSTPSERPPEDSVARALDSHSQGIDPVPPVPRE